MHRGGGRWSQLRIGGRDFLLVRNFRNNYHALAVALLLISFGIIYICTMPIEWITGDPAAEVRLVLTPTNYLRANHLLLTAVYTQILNIVGIFGYDGPPFIPLQIVNVLAGICCVALMYFLITQFIKAPVVAVFGAATLGSSFGIWLHSTTVETGILAQLCLMSSLVLLFKNHPVHKIISVKLAFASILFSTAVLFALNMVVLMPCLLLTVYYSADQDKKRKITRSLIFFALASIFVGTCYLYAAKQNELKSLQEVYNWVTYHSAKQQLSHVSFGIMGIFRSFSGALSSILSMESYTAIVKALLLGIKTKPIDALVYFRLALGLTIGSIISLLMLWGFLRAPKREIGFIAFTAIVFNFLFCSLWLGSDPQFWIPVLPFIILMVGFGLRNLLAIAVGRGRLVVYALYTILLSLSMDYNFGAKGPTIASPQGGEAWQKAKHFSRIAKNGDVIIFAGSTWPRYLPALNEEIEILSLVYSEKLMNLRGEEFLLSIENHINNITGSGKKALFDDFEGEPHVDNVGAWESIRSLRGVGRKELKDHLMTKFAVVEFETQSPGLSNISVILPHGS